MNPKSDDMQPAKPARATAKPSREDRLKAALKANMAKRKAQARAKAVSADGADGAVRDGELGTE